MVSSHTISYNQSINSENQLYLIKADPRNKEKDDKRECGHYYIQSSSNHLPRKPNRTRVCYLVSHSTGPKINSEIYGTFTQMMMMTYKPSNFCFHHWRRMKMKAWAPSVAQVLPFWLIGWMETLGGHSRTTSYWIELNPSFFFSCPEQLNRWPCH